MRARLHGDRPESTMGDAEVLARSSHGASAVAFV